MRRAHRPVLIVGLPRSGTTWTESVIGTAVGATTVSEPDNEKLSAPAIWAKRKLGRFPVLAPGERSQSYERLWRWALLGAPSSAALRAAAKLVGRADPNAAESLVRGRPPLELRLAGALGSHLPTVEASNLVIAKSVHAVLAIDWITDRFDVDVLVLLRHPANVLSSWLELDLPDRDRDLGGLAAVRRRYLDLWDIPPAGNGALERAAWQLGLLTSALEHSVDANPRWLMRTHEQLCSDPEGEFRRLFADLGLEWGSNTSKLLEQSDNPGTGFSLNRKASELAESWRGRLNPDDLETLSRTLRRFPLRTWDAKNLAHLVNGTSDWLAPRQAPHAGETSGPAET